MTDFANHLLNYGKEIGLPDLAFSEEGICSLNFDSKINVDIVYQEEQDQCILASELGTIPVDGKEAFFKALLVANAFGTENAGAVIGIDEDENKVVFSYTFIASIVSFDLFKTILMNFVNMVEEWIPKCENLKTSSSSGPTSAMQIENESNLPSGFEFTRV